MEAKKTPKADLEKKKLLYLEIGLIVILALSLFAFNIKSYDIDEIETSQRTALNEIEDITIQTENEMPEPEPPKPEPVQVETLIEVVDNNTVITDEVKIDAGDDANKAQEVYVAPVQIKQDEEVQEEEVLIFVEQSASFKGGDDALYAFINKNIVYPEAARNNAIQGKVYVKFVVEKDGRVTNVRVARDIGGGCGEEAVRVVKSMPAWNPGKQQNRAVRSEFNLPVIFKLYN